MGNTSLLTQVFIAEVRFLWWELKIFGISFSHSSSPIQLLFLPLCSTSVTIELDGHLAHYNPAKVKAITVFTKSNLSGQIHSLNLRPKGVDRIPTIFSHQNFKNSISIQPGSASS